MSSSPRTKSPRTGLAGWSLRARLVATVLGLLALICVIVGVTTEVVTRHLLYAAKDQQLVASSGRGGRIFGEGPAHPPDFEGCTTDTNLFPPGQAAGTVAAHIQRDGPVCAQLLTDNGRQVLSSALNTTFMAVPVDGRPHTVRLADLGDYRVIATHAPNGDGDTVITALPLSDVEHTLRAVILTEVCVSLGGLLLAGAIGTAMVRGELRPLRRVAATASRVSELPLERGDVALSVRVPTVDTDPRTEVGQVGAALNRMLGHIAGALRVRQASETRMRQFLADASHELRTPLAAIRGYAELSRRMDGQVPPDLAHAMRRVESEARRMTALVEDLLLLARLDSGRPLEREPVDLSGLVVDAVSDAHAAGPDHQWHLSVPEDPVVVTGDPLRLHQVLANLLANARTHTPPGTRVIVGLSAVDGQARLVVADNGPGIPENLLPEVFNRFARADTSRSRAAGSTGLGLAIVAAVVETHHGTVDVESAPGSTVFTVTLPLVATATPPQLH